MNEADVIARLRRIASDPAARGLLDDAAVLDDDIDATGAMLRHASLPIILTRRAALEGGENRDADVDRVRFLNECAVATPRYTDLELATHRKFPEAARREGDGWSAILLAR